jgi:hypothetical protein
MEILIVGAIAFFCGWVAALVWDAGQKEKEDDDG